MGLRCAGWQREGDDGVARLRRILSAAARRNRPILPAVDHVDAGRRVPTRWQLVFPEHSAGGLFECTELFVRCCRDEDESSASRDSTAEIEAAGVADALCHELGILAEWNLPQQIARDEIDGVQCSPGWSYSGHPVLIEKQRVSIDRETIRRAFRASGSARLPRRRFDTSTARAVRAAGTAGMPAWRCAPAQSRFRFPDSSLPGSPVVAPASGYPDGSPHDRLRMFVQRFAGPAASGSAIRLRCRELAAAG